MALGTNVVRRLVLVLSNVVYRFPADWWKVALVAVGWFVFASSMADKSVTLVSVTDSSGELRRFLGRGGSPHRSEC